MPPDADPVLPASSFDQDACQETDWGTSGILSARLWRIAEERCIPLGATIEVTSRCNLRCAHCYNLDRSEPGPKENGGAELTVDEISSIIDQLADAGCLYLTLTGGEPLVHPGLDDLIRHARRRRLAVRLKSNGTLLTIDRVQRLADAGVVNVDISLYGARPKTHDACTGQTGSFAQTIEGIRNAREAGLVVKVNISLVHSNAGEVELMIALMEELELPYGISPSITARYDGTSDPLGLRVDQQTLETLYRGPMGHLVREPHPNAAEPIRCTCARATCAISTTGDLYPCIGMPLPSGNLRQQALGEIWQRSPQLNRIRSLRLDDFEACNECPDLAYCGRWPCTAFTNTGQYTSPEPFTCMEAAIVRNIHASRQSAQPIST